MNYQFVPTGKTMENGMFFVPSLIADNYIKLASEYQLKALLLILSKGGLASGKEIAKTLGCTESDAEDFLEFWVDEGILSCDSNLVIPEQKKEPVQKKKPETKEKKSRLETLPVPTLTSKDVTAALRDNPELESLLQSAQEIFGRPLSHIQNEMIINMVQYYGLPGEVVLTILQYYKSEKDKGRAVGNAYIGAMAKNWSEEGITTLDAAEEKLRELENSDKLWREILLSASISFRNPTVNQREMIKRWTGDFSFDMIAYACDLMKENAEKPTLKYVDSILRNWQKAKITTLEQAKADNENRQNKNEKAKSGKLQVKPSFDISEIEKKALFDDNYDI